MHSATLQMPRLSPPADISLGTERLRLRPPSVDDAASIAALVTPEVSRWMASWPSPCTAEFAAARIGEQLAAMAEGRALPLVIDKVEDGKTIGFVEAFMSGEDPGRVTLGFWLGERFHGQGFMTEAVRAVLRHLAADPAVRVIDGGARAANVASKRVMAKLGMRPVGTRMIYASARACEEPCEFQEIAASAVE